MSRGALAKLATVNPFANISASVQPSRGGGEQLKGAAAIGLGGEETVRSDEQSIGRLAPEGCEALCVPKIRFG